MGEVVLKASVFSMEWSRKQSYQLSMGLGNEVLEVHEERGTVGKTYDCLPTMPYT